MPAWWAQDPKFDSWYQKTKQKGTLEAFRLHWHWPCCGPLKKQVIASNNRRQGALLNYYTLSWIQYSCLVEALDCEPHRKWDTGENQQVGNYIGQRLFLMIGVFVLSYFFQLFLVMWLTWEKTREISRYCIPIPFQILRISCIMSIREQKRRNSNWTC